MNGCRQNESPKTADKNIAIIHTTLVHELMSCVCVCNEQIHQDVFNVQSIINSIHCFRVKGEFSTVLSPMKKSSHLNQESNIHSQKHL